MGLTRLHLSRTNDLDFFCVAEMFFVKSINFFGAFGFCKFDDPDIDEANFVGLINVRRGR